MFTTVASQHSAASSSCTSPYVSANFVHWYTANQRLHLSINSSPSCTQFKNSVLAQKQAVRCSFRWHPAAMFSSISLHLLLLLLLRALCLVLFVTNKTQLVSPGHLPCFQLTSAIDGLFGRKRTANIPHKSAWRRAISSRNRSELVVCRMAFLVASPCIQRGQSILLPYCYHCVGHYERNSGGERPKKKKCLSEFPGQTPCCWPRTLCKFTRSGLETIEDISKTIDGSHRTWTLDWFSIDLLWVETKTGGNNNGTHAATQKETGPNSIANTAETKEENGAKRKRHGNDGNVMQ